MSARNRYRSVQLPPPPRRFWPQGGQLLTHALIRGPWRASGSVAGGGFFSVVWTTPGGIVWYAPLHDFTPASQRVLLDQCAALDRDAGYPGAWPEGRLG